MDRYYFDHNASTPVAAEVLEAMLPLFGEVYGNASSIHYFGQAARRRLDEARRTVASMLGAAAEEIVFTSGGTEADNLAVLGVARDGHVITTAVEHPAVLAAAAQCASMTVIQPDTRGLIDPGDIRRALRPGTKLISVMHANNELGVIQPIEEIAAIAREAGVVFHSDGVQAAGKIPPAAAPADLYTISGHKIYAPKGIGALRIRKGTKLAPRSVGGHHEHGLRAGTENVAGAVALARAARWVMEFAAAEQAREAPLRDRLERQILERVPDAHVNGAGAPRTANTTNIRFDGIDSDALLIALDLRGFAVSSGAACSSGATEPSHVLTAIGLNKDQGRSSIRVSLGRANTAEQVDLLIEAVVASVAHLRKLAPAYA